MTTKIVEIPVNSSRRAALLATSVVGGAGITISVVPFVASMAPSQRALAQGGLVVNAIVPADVLAIAQAAVLIAVAVMCGSRPSGGGKSGASGRSLS